MKKYANFVIVSFILFFGFCLNVNGAVMNYIENSKSIPIPSDRKLIYYDYVPTKNANNMPEFKITLTGAEKNAFEVYTGNYSGLGYTSLLTFRTSWINNKGKRVYLIDNTNVYKHTFKDVATITIPNAGWYADGVNIVRVDLTVSVKDVYIEFFGQCKQKRYYYRISSFVDYLRESNGNERIGRISASVWRFDKDHVKSTDADKMDVSTDSGCNINGKYTYEMKFTKHGGGDVPSNMAFLWNLWDIDQPDDSLKSGKESPQDASRRWGGDFVESVEFNSGFTGNFYVYNNTVLKTNASNTLYKASASTSSESNCVAKRTAECKKSYNSQKNINACIAHDCASSAQTAVHAIQSLASATIVWRGSRDLATAIIGNRDGQPNPRCTPAGGDKFYKLDGSLVGYAEYKEDCFCREGITVDGKKVNLGKDGTSVDQDTFNSQCKHRCEYYNGKWYGNVWDNVVNSKFDYEIDCLYKYKGNVCRPSNNSNSVTVGCGSDKGSSINDEVSSVDNDTYNNVTITSDSHSSCKSHDVVKTNVFFQKFDGNESLEVIDGNGNKKNYTESRCVPVEINIPVVLTENVNVSVAGLSGNTIYAGGGFGWGGSTAQSTIGWVERYLRSKKEEENYFTVFTVKYGGKLKVGDEPGFSNIDQTTDSIKLYSNANCSGSSVTENELKTIIKNSLSSSVNANHNFDFSASSYPNDASNSDVSMASYLNETNSKELLEGINELFRITSSVKLKEAYINRYTADISYYAADEAPNESTFVYAGNLYYIPLKYKFDKFNIFMKDVNLSAIGQVRTFSSTCSIGVTKLNYKYRSVKVSDMFNGKNKGNVAKNWADWYCGNDVNCNINNTSYGANKLNKDRISNSYNNLLYKIDLTPSKFNEIIKYNKENRSYGDFDSFKPADENVISDGSSSFVIDRFDKNDIPTTASYCKLGEFDAKKCDVQVKLSK